jgi:hypothetical protein
MQNKGCNKYFFLPFIFWLIGLYFQFARDKNNGWVVLLLFLMTGIAIGVYLNMYAYQPRERDYAFAASFYAFAIWIGLGVYAIYEWTKKYYNPTVIAAASTVVCLSIPMLLCAQNWDDHDRSKRLLTRAIGKAYLDACEPNAILFTNGDNDTFPLWYLQEVEGYRTDVRICNLSLMGTDWYIDQVKRKAYDGEPVPIRMTKEMYQMGTRDFLIAVNRIKEPQDLKKVMQEIYKPTNNIREAEINTISFYLDVDKEKVLQNGTVTPENADKIVDRLVWNLSNKSLLQTNGVDSVLAVSKAYIAMMDILAHNNWERPIYYVSTTSDEAFLGLNKYLQMEGLVYRLIPVDFDYQSRFLVPGGVTSSVLYDRLMNKSDYSQYADKNIFLSEDYTRIASNIKLYFLRLTETLVQENKMDSAITALNKCYSWLPAYNIPYGELDAYLAFNYLSTLTPAGVEKGVKLYNELIDQLFVENAYYRKFTGNKASYVARDFSRNMSILGEINARCLYLKSFLDEKQSALLDPIIEKTQAYGSGGNPM